MIKKILLLTIICGALIFTSKGQSFQLNSAISYANSIVKGQYEDVSVTVKNTGASKITVDFECDLTDINGGFKSVIGKVCNQSIAALSTANLRFYPGYATDASSIGVPAGTYKIQLIFSTISSPNCPGCGTKSPSCIYNVKSGSYTNPVTLIVTEACTLPTAPIGLSATGVSTSQINLSWNSLIGATSYQVVYGVGSCPWGAGGVILVTTNCNTCTTATATGLNANTTYRFIVIAYNACGWGNTFNCVSATTLSPCNYSLSPSSNTSVPNTGGLNSISVSTGSTCTWTPSASNSWIGLIYGGTKTGNDICSYNVESNPNNTTRTGYIYIDNKTFTVTQAAANYVNADFTLNSSGYVNSPIYITNNSNGSPDINSWTWDFGDGSTSSTSAQFFSHTYTSTGSKTITLSVGNSNGNTSTTSRTISITYPPAPIADFYSDKRNIKPNTTVTFTDNSKNGPTSWQWTFDGGTPANSTEQNPTVVYKKPYTFSVSLIASNATGSDPEKKIGFITVSPDGTNQVIPPPPNAINAPQIVKADPIQTGTGTYKYSHKDFSLPTVDGSINFTRFYNSVNNKLNSPVGYAWSHSYNYYIDIQRDVATQIDTVWSLHYPDGHFADYIPLAAANPGTYPRLSFALYSGTLDSLAMVNSNQFILYTKDNRQYQFNASGQLTQITDLNNNTTTINYSGNNVASIVGQGGRTLMLGYTGSLISSVTEPGNRKCSFTYDANGNLTSVQDPKGGITHYTYDVNHRMTTIVNSLGDTFIANIYDSKGRVIKQTDADNQATTLAYDTPSAGKTTITNPDNSKIIATHDQFFRKTNLVDELGLSQSFTYDNRSNETSFTNENGVTISRQYDWNGNTKSQTIGSDITSSFIYNTLNAPTQITDPNGKSSVITYDAKNNPTAIQFSDNTYQYFAINSDGTRNKITDGRNNATTYSYDRTGDMVSTTAPNGTKNFGYDLSGRLISVTDENNHQTQITYDENDNIKIISDALARTTEFSYDANNQLLTVKDKNGNLTKFTYDKKGRLKTTTNPNGGITSYTYDVRDNLITITDPKNNVVSLAYDKKGRKSSITNALGASQYQYDGVGNRTKVIDGTGKTTDFTYSITNKMKSIKDGLMNSTTYAYDKNDNMISLINAINKSTTYTYDSMNRLISVLDAANKTTSITYDENGNKKSISDPNGHIQTFNYDAANRLIQNIDAAGNSSSYNYDPSGNILSLVTSTGTISKSYDSANRVITVTNPGGNNYTFTYDKNDNLISMQNGTGTSSMVYDAFNQLTQYIDPYNKAVAFTYDALGNKTAITYPGNHKVNYTYDAVNNLKSVTDWLNQTFTYTYDAAGRNTKLTYPNGIQCDLVFDNAARLTGKKNATSSNAIINSSQFVLDAIGNRTSEQREGPIPTNLLPTTKSYSYANDDALKTNGAWNYSNDASGNRIQEIKGDKDVKYSFSVDNLLNNTVDTLGVTTSFNYDALGHRLSKSITTNESWYVLDLSSGLSQVLQITDGSGAIKAEYVYGLGLLETIDTANKALFYHFDAQHNTVALTNPGSTITDTYAYDPFGTLLMHTGNTSQPFTFLGEFGVEQENTSVYFVRARYYDAANSRFLSKDPYPGDLTNPQTINRYSYGINNPIVNIDPYGLFSWNSLCIASLQAIEGVGNLAQVGISGIIASGSGFIAGPSEVLSAADSFNDATKDFKASFSNVKNAFNSNSNWITADSYKGALDYIGFDNPSVKALRDVNTVVSGISGAVEFVKTAPKGFVGILTSNYDVPSKVQFLRHFVLKAESPILNISDYFDGLDSLENIIKVDIPNAINFFNNGNSCKK